MENKISIAEEFIMDYWDVDCEFVEDIRKQMSKMRGIDFNNIPDLMIEFAKLHVKAALLAAVNNAELDRDAAQDLNGISVNKDSILNAYPEENIK